MSLKQYFEDALGMGVLSTADKQGLVNSAVFSRPHVVDEQTVAFIMPERLTWANLQENPHASFLFCEEGSKSVGKRLYLTMTGQDGDQQLVSSMRRHKNHEDGRKRYVVYFSVDKILPLVGAR